MRSRTYPGASALALALLMGLGALGLAFPLSETAYAQLPPTPSDPTNNTTQPHQDDVVQIGVFTDKQFESLDEGGVMRVILTYQDASIQPTAFTKPSVTVFCNGQNITEQGNWAYVPPMAVPLSRGQVAVKEFLVLSSLKPYPEVFQVEVTCTSSDLPGRVLAQFVLTAKAKPYYYSAVEVAEFLQPLSPDEEFQIPIRVKNNGNQLAHYAGEILQPPAGWVFAKPPDVMIPPGEERIVNVSGIAPRDQLLYLFHSDGVRVSYYPMEQPGRGQVAFVPLTVDGIYLHPAIIPLTTLGLILLGVFIFMVLYAKRQIEEQILGKPVPPWRIPVERERLDILEKEDPDQFYIVRHYLMEEEHASALLWYHHYKKATKADRAAETRWFKVKRKQERKIAALEKDHTKLERKWVRKLKFLDWRRRRKVKKVERKLAVINKGLQAKLDKKHKAEVAKIKKRFRKDKKNLKKRQKKAEKKTLRLYDREVRKAERALYRENKKRAKRGEDLLPPADIPQPEMPKLVVAEPVYPERPIATELLLSETKLQKRMDRVQARFAKKRTRKEARRDRALARHRAKIDGKTQRLLAKIPAEPKTHLYDKDDYLSEDEVIVEDDRSLIARWLNLPTLEEQEYARRRRDVRAAERSRLKATGDAEALARFDAEWKDEKARLRAERKERMLAAHAAAREESSLAKQRQKDAKRRAKELTKEAKVEAKHLRADRKAARLGSETAIPVKGPNGEAPPDGNRLKIKFGGRKRTGESEEAKAETAPVARERQE